MTSFATDEAIRAHVAERELGEPLVFHQFVSLRLDPSGELFLDDDGCVSLYAPGHGDLFRALRTSGVLDAFRDRGVRVVTVSNVDNLGARVDPVVVGAHLLAARPLTSEVARKEGDVGGAPVRVDGRLRLVEGPCFPPDFDQDLVPVFNTNTALLGLEALDEDYDLSWLYVVKDVGGREAVQLERAVPRGLGLRAHDVPRGAAARPAREVRTDQDAGGPRTRAAGPSRARLGVGLTQGAAAARLAALTWRVAADAVAPHSAQIRREVVTYRGLASSRARARRAPPRALRGLPRTRPRPLPIVPRPADPAGAARVCALRVAGALAGAALCGVCGEEAGVRGGACGPRLRPRRAVARAGVEGERQARPRP